jgi:hypothetical protein
MAPAQTDVQIHRRTVESPDSGRMSSAAAGMLRVTLALNYVDCDEKRNSERSPRLIDTMERANLPEIWEPAQPGVARIFNAIPDTVGVAGVHLFWRTLAAHPSYLEPIWPALEQDLRSEELEQTAARLRETAFISEAVGMPSHKAFRGDMVRAEIDAEFRERIERFNDASQTNLSRLLAACAALLLGLEGGDFGDAAQTHVSSARPTFLEFAVPPLRGGEAAGKARDLLNRIDSQHELPMLDDYYRSLARAPEFLSAAWNAIQPLSGDEIYLDRARSLAGIADERGIQLPSAAYSESAANSLQEQERSFLHTLLRAFHDLVLPQTLIDVTLIKALLSGPSKAFDLRT